MRKKRASPHISADRHRLCFAILRLVRGHENKEIAAKANISYQTIRKWRMPVASGGTLAPKIENLDRVARAFGMKLQFVEIRENRSVGTYDGVEARV